MRQTDCPLLPRYTEMYVNLHAKNCFTENVQVTEL